MLHPIDKAALGCSRQSESGVPSDDLGEDNEQRDAALVMTKKAQEEGCLWFIWRLTLVFIVAPGITLAVVIPKHTNAATIATPFVEDEEDENTNTIPASKNIPPK